MADKLVPTFNKETDSFKTNEVMLSGNFITGQVYTREPSVFANNIAEELGIEDFINKGIGSSTGNIPEIGGVLTTGEVVVTNGGTLDAQPAKTAFNKDFGGTGTATTVARSDHSHDGLTTINNVHCLTNRFTGATTKTFTYSQLEAYMNYTPSLAISPALNIEVYEFTDPQYIMLDKSSYTVNITVREHVTNKISLNTVAIGGLTSSKTYMVNITFKDDDGFDVGGGA